MVKKILAYIYLYFYKKKLQKKFKLKLGKKVYINRSTTFEGANYLSNYSALKDSHIGYASYLGERTVLRKTHIGKYTSIGPDVKCIFGKHPSHTYVSTHPAFFSTLKQVGFSFTEKQLFEEYASPIDKEKKFQIKIGNDVWIGANVSIMDGVRIGDGAIIAANTLVIKDIAPYSIVGGVPSKLIKQRFKEKEINFLLTYKWWNKDLNWIKKHSYLFKDITNFMKQFADQ